MIEKPATVKAHVTGAVRSRTPRTASRRPTTPGPQHDSRGNPDRTRRGVGRYGRGLGRDPGHRPRPAYLMARQEPLTEREVREALGLSHRAASLALAEAESWGIVERVPEPRRSAVVGRRALPISRSATTGSGSAGSSPSGRSARATPSSRSSKRRSERPRPLAAHPDDTELAALRDWLSAFLVFVRLFDRAVGLVPQLDPRELERSLQLLGRIPTRRSSACSTCWAASTTTTSSISSTRCPGCRRLRRGARPS